MTATPRRIQRSRAKGWRMPPGAIDCTRPGMLGNPFPVSQYGIAQAVAMHEVWLGAHGAEALGYVGQEAAALNAHRKLVLAKLPDLRGHDLACWCSLPAPGERDLCHAATLLRLANPPLKCEAP